MIRLHADEHCPKRRDKRLGRIILSTMAAALGVQSDKNRKRDFSEGNLYVYIFAGLAGTALFITSLILLVRYLLASA